MDARLAESRREVEAAREALAAEQEARAQEQQAAAAQVQDLKEALEREAAAGREEGSQAAQHGGAKDARIEELEKEVADMRSSLMQARASSLHRTLSQVRSSAQQAQDRLQRRLAMTEAEVAARDASLREAQAERDAALRLLRDLEQAQPSERGLLEQVRRMLAAGAAETDGQRTPPRYSPPGPSGSAEPGSVRATRCPLQRVGRGSRRSRHPDHRRQAPQDPLSPLAAATAAAGDARTAIELASWVPQMEVCKPRFAAPPHPFAKPTRPVPPPARRRA